MRKRIWITTAVFGIGAATASFGSGPRTRPWLLPGIPDRDYQQGGPFPQTQILSLEAALLEASAPVNGAVVRPRMRYFQLDREALRLGHCFLSKVAVTIHEDGRWTLNCRADQNPWFSTEARGLPALRLSSPAVEQETIHLLRNEFQVTLSFVMAPLNEKRELIGTGRPVFVKACPAPFWVQRGQPKNHVTGGVHPDFVRFFDAIDRAEIEFKVR